MSDLASLLEKVNPANCPFCGDGKFVRLQRYQFPPDDEGPAWKWGYHVICDASGIEGTHKGCGSSSAWGETTDEALAAWNRRAPLTASPHPEAYGVRAAVIEECAKLAEDRAAAQSQFQKSAYSRGDDIGGHGHWKAQCELLSLVAAIRALSADLISALECEMEEARVLNNKYAWERDKAREERDATERQSESFWKPRLTAAEAKVARMGEALKAMLQRFELYAGPNDIHAGHHDLELLKLARAALQSTPTSDRS